MAMIKISDDEIVRINIQNKGNLFYRNWMMVLAAAERGMKELPSQLIWKLSNEMIEYIQSCPVYDGMQLQTYYSSLVRKCKKVEIGDDNEIRDDDKASRSATAVFTLVMFRLLNARHEKENVESMPTYPYIKGIGELLYEDKYSEQLRKYFLGIETDDNGNPTEYEVENPIDTIKVEEKPKTNKRGRKQASLFLDESEENIQERANEFMTYLKDKYHKKFIIVTEKNDFINKSIYAFAYNWNKQSIICKDSYKSGTRIYRFLTEICKIETNTKESIYKSSYSKWVKDPDFTGGTKCLGVESYISS